MLCYKYLEWEPPNCSTCTHWRPPRPSTPWQLASCPPPPPSQLRVPQEERRGLCPLIWRIPWSNQANYGITQHIYCVFLVLYLLICREDNEEADVFFDHDGSRVDALESTIDTEDKKDAMNRNAKVRSPKICSSYRQSSYIYACLVY